MILFLAFPSFSLFFPLSIFFSLHESKRNRSLLEGKRGEGGKEIETTLTSGKNEANVHDTTRMMLLRTVWKASPVTMQEGGESEIECKHRTNM